MQAKEWNKSENKLKYLLKARRHFTQFKVSINLNATQTVFVWWQVELDKKVFLVFQFKR